MLSSIIKFNKMLFIAQKEQAKRVASAESCRHGQMSYREKKEHARLQEEDKERTERIKILEVFLICPFQSQK